MVKAVFTTKVDPTYDDLPEERYHFPKTYLRAVEKAVGDWIAYYEPRRSSGDKSSRGGRQAYFAVARLNDIISDPSTPDHYYALVSDYLELDQSVPFREADFFYESALRKPDDSVNRGAFGRAVRNIPDNEYDLIFQAGFAAELGALSPEYSASDKNAPLGLHEDPSPIFNRPVTQMLVSKKFRDAAFARHVKVAYSDTCAITGLKIINGGGRAEVQAAHIRPVASDGPDSVRNGLALSGTIHWMFDRGLISVDDDYSILLAKDKVPDTVDRLVNADRYIRLPTIQETRPHPQFMRFHRENVFKG